MDNSLLVSGDLLEVKREANTLRVSYTYNFMGIDFKQQVLLKKAYLQDFKQRQELEAANKPWLKVSVDYPALNQMILWSQ